MNKKTTDIIAYITIVGWLVAYFAGTREESKFHLNQGLLVGLLMLALAVIARVLSIIPIIGWLAGIVIWLLDLGLLALAIIGIVNAANGREERLPVIGAFQLL